MVQSSTEAISIIKGRCAKISLNKKLLHAIHLGEISLFRYVILSVRGGGARSLYMGHHFHSVFFEELVQFQL